MLKEDPLGTALAALILLSVVLTAGLCYWYLQSARNYSLLQMEVSAINRNRTVAQQLAAETVEYSKTNPSILPLLQSVGINPKQNPSSDKAGK
jgi:hypothetical protein